MLRFFFFYWVCFLLVFGQEEYYNSVESRVMDGLKDENWQVRKDAANILGQIRSKKAVDEMNERIFKEENHEVMAEYCHALGLIGEIRAEDPLVTIITSKLKISNELADIGLKRLSKKEKEAQEAKLQENQEKFQKVYREAIWSLGRIQSKKAVKAICTWAITAPTEEVRQTAVNALIEIGDPEAIYFLSQAVAKPINRELDPLEQKYRMHAFSALVEILPQFKQNQHNTLNPPQTTEGGGSQVQNPYSQRATFIYRRLFQLPESLGKLVEVNPFENYSHLWFESEKKIFRVTLRSDGSFDKVVYEIERYKN